MHAHTHTKVTQISNPYQETYMNTRLQSWNNYHTPCPFTQPSSLNVRTEPERCQLFFLLLLNRLPPLSIQRKHLTPTDPLVVTTTFPIFAFQACWTSLLTGMLSVNKPDYKRQTTYDYFQNYHTYLEKWITIVILFSTKSVQDKMSILPGNIWD